MTDAINKKQPMREAEQAIADYLNTTVATYMLQETAERKEADAAEVARAEAAEKILTDDLTAEVARAEAAENGIKGDLNSETSARSDADSLLQANIDIVNGKFPVKTENIGTAQITKDKLHENLQQLIEFCETLPDFEFGFKNVGSIAANSSSAVTLTFNSAKAEAPIILSNAVANGSNLNLSAYTQYSTTTQAVVNVVNNASTSVSNVTLDYMAVSGR